MCLALPAAGRKQGDETPEVFRAVMEQIAEALIAAAAALLSPTAQASAPPASLPARLPGNVDACMHALAGRPGVAAWCAAPAWALPGRLRPRLLSHKA